MLTATDSFIQYLATNLSPIPVYWWRQSDFTEHAGFLKQDALNVQVLGFYEDGSGEHCLVSLDLLGSDERVVLGRLQTIRNVLTNEQFTPELDFTDPDNPVATGRDISWAASQINFLNVRTPQGATYVHYNATFPLLHTRESGA